MKEIYHNQILRIIKSASNHQVQNTMKNKCIWWGYEPKVPEILMKRKEHQKTEKFF